ncbi:uncharacterized protein HMPREF1541_09691 [Cyphellophora europaea CBS 101466]|uniref:Transcription factor domain-containing protein n=1 Tax=Cyphellophora europaea (strain CBS 101466) TaxID=1220924 RepID=W2S7Y7_CYPE1|nr:uncharacterized protein HMPREF1541_09691 [Cyphellophora europaea CBS 101466]ETN44816.1 hypothetical protein HMPREF1541_09691 [Cyphellophora europaea CBS 101466]
MSALPGLFIEYLAEGRSSRRDRELLDAKARSHAARYAYQRSLLQRQRSRGSRGSSSNSSSSTRAGSKSSDVVTGSNSGRGGRSRSPQHQAAALIEAAGLRQEGSDLPEQFLVLDEDQQFTHDMLGRATSPPHSYPVSLDSNRLRAIEYFPELWSRWAADVIPNRAQRQVATDTAVSSIVRRCLTDELHMTAFIAYVLQRAPAVDVSKVFLLQMAGKALAELRARIEGGNATLEEVVWPIIFLAHFELFGSKSVGAGRAHLKAVVELGGMEYLDEVTKVYIRRMDRGWWSDYPSIFLSPLSPQRQWEKLVPKVPEDDVAGSGFLDHADMLGEDLVNLLPSVVDCVRAGVLCKDRVLRGLENEVLQNKVIRKCQALMDTLRQWLPAEPEKMACIYPAMIWLQYTTWVMRDLATKASSSVDAYRNVTSHAHANLLRCVEQSSQAHEMLLWAAVMGITTSADEVARVLYASRGLSLARSLDVVDLRDSWKRYIWFEACAIIDYGLILAALNAAVRLDPSLATQQWESVRKGPLLRLSQDG